MSSRTVHEFNVTLIGSPNCGKSSFINIMTSNHPDKIMILDDNVLEQQVAFHFIDDTHDYLSESICIALIYDITNPHSYEYVKSAFLSFKDSLASGHYFTLILGCKSDLEKQRVVSVQEVEQFATKFGMFFLETSAVTKKNLELIQKVMRIRSIHLLKRNQAIVAKPSLLKNDQERDTHTESLDDRTHSSLTSMSAQSTVRKTLSTKTLTNFSPFTIPTNNKQDTVTTNSDARSQESEEGSSQTFERSPKLKELTQSMERSSQGYERSSQGAERNSQNFERSERSQNNSQSQSIERPALHFMGIKSLDMHESDRSNESLTNIKEKNIIISKQTSIQSSLRCSVTSDHMNSKEKSPIKSQKTSQNSSIRGSISSEPAHFKEIPRESNGYFPKSAHYSTDIDNNQNSFDTDTVIKIEVEDYSQSLDPEDIEYAQLEQETHLNEEHPLTTPHFKRKTEPSRSLNQAEPHSEGYHKVNHSGFSFNPNGVGDNNSQRFSTARSMGESQASLRDENNQFKFQDPISEKRIYESVGLDKEGLMDSIDRNIRMLEESILHLDQNLQSSNYQSEAGSDTVIKLHTEPPLELKGQSEFMSIHHMSNIFNPNPVLLEPKPEYIPEMNVVRLGTHYEADEDRDEIPETKSLNNTFSEQARKNNRFERMRNEDFSPDGPISLSASKDYGRDKLKKSKSSVFGERRKSVDTVRVSGGRNKIPLLYIQVENENQGVDLVAVYQDDDPQIVAERYLTSLNKPYTKTKLQAVANLFDDKIYESSLVVEDFISKYENQILKERNTADRNMLEKMIHEAKPFNLNVDQRPLQRNIEEALLGKLYVELENKKVVVLNIKESDDPHNSTCAFMSTYSLKKDYFKLIYGNIHKIKEQGSKTKSSGEPIVKNLVLKEYKPAGDQSMKENITPSVNKSQKTLEKSKSPIKGTLNRPKPLFKLNFDTGNGRIGKLVIHEGENLQKAAQNFVTTYKLGNNAYTQILEVIEHNYRIKANQ